MTSPTPRRRGEAQGRASKTETPKSSERANGDRQISTTPNTSTPTKRGSAARARGKDGVPKNRRDTTSAPSTPFGKMPDNSARQLLEAAFTRLCLDNEKQWLDELDAADDSKAQAHVKALAQSFQIHENVRASAERARLRLEEQMKLELKRREEAEVAALERLRQAKQTAELQEKKRLLEEQRAQESERRKLEDETRRLEDEREQVEADRRAQERRREEEKQQRERDRVEAERKEREASQQQRQPPTPAAAPASSQPAPAVNGVSTVANKAATNVPKGLVSLQQQRDAEHRRYLQIHKNLKEMRKFVVKASKSDRQLKSRLGDMRRQIKATLGQLTTDKRANAVPRNKILSLLAEALQYPQPQVDITQYIITDTPSSPETMGPGVLVYLFNILSKTIISQLISEAGATEESSKTEKAATAIGVLAVTAFADERFHWHGRTLIDMLLAKYHVVCPVLFGVYGPDTTAAGKQRLGWWSEDNVFVPDNRHYQRMTGLGAGFAALTLRNFTRSSKTSPYPNWHYWQALARIINTPAEEATQTHFVVLKGMVDGFVPLFIQLFGQPALVALRQALVEWPQRVKQIQLAKRGRAAADVVTPVAALPDALRREQKIFL